MSDKLGRFENEAFFRALDATRQSRALNWRQVAAKAGVSASTLTRMAQGKRPDVDSLAALVTWSGLDPGDYLVNPVQRAEPETMALISTYLRADRDLSPDSALALEQIIQAAYQRLRGPG